MAEEQELLTAARGKKPIYLNLDASIKEKVRLCGWKYETIFIRGIQAIEGTAGENRRIMQLEEENKALQNNIMKLQRKLSHIVTAYHVPPEVVIRC